MGNIQKPSKALWEVLEFVCTQFFSQEQKQAKEIGYMISQQTLQEFKEIFEKEIGPMPDEKVLHDSACDLLTLLDNTYRPIKKEWVEKFPPGQKEMVENGQFIAPGQKINQENQENNSPRAKITGNNR